MNEREPREPMERYRAGEMSVEEARRFESRILSEDDLSDELYDDVSIESSLREGARRRPRRVTRPVAWLVPLAAAALILLAIQMQRPDPDESPVLRGSGQSVELLAPIGPQAVLPEVFRWRRWAGAESYRLELMDSEARPVFQTVLADTFWSPARVDPGIPAAGSWQVTPLDDLMMGIVPGSIASYRVQP